MLKAGFCDNLVNHEPTFIILLRISLKTMRWDGSLAQVFLDRIDGVKRIKKYEWHIALDYLA